MAEKSFRFIDKTELLDIMRRQEAEIERLNAEIAKLAADRDGQAQKPAYGSDRLLDEVSLSVEGVMKAAQEAADVYLQGVREQADAMIKAARRECDELMGFIDRSHSALHDMIDSYKRCPSGN